MLSSLVVCRVFQIVGIITRHNLTHEYLMAKLRQHYITIWETPCPGPAHLLLAPPLLSRPPHPHVTTFQHPARSLRFALPPRTSRVIGRAQRRRVQVRTRFLSNQYSDESEGRQGDVCWYILRWWFLIVLFSKRIFTLCPLWVVFLLCCFVSSFYYGMDPSAWPLGF